MSLESRVRSYSRVPTATVTIDGRVWRDWHSLSLTSAFGQGVAGGQIEGRSPPVEPRPRMPFTWTWGYDGYEVRAMTGEIVRASRRSHPNNWSLEVKDILHLAEKANTIEDPTQSEVEIKTQPLNGILASEAIRYLLRTYAGITRTAIPVFPASGAAWVGSEWKLGILTPVRWTNTSALRACQDIASVLGFWLFADPAGIVRAVQMERAPGATAFWTYKAGVDLLLDGAPEREINPDAIYNKVIVLGANTGILGAQVRDIRRTNHPFIAAGRDQVLSFANPMIEYVSAVDAGAASAETVAARLVQLHSRVPSIIRARIKADPRLAIGMTLGIEDAGVGLSAATRFFITRMTTSMNRASGEFNQQLELDGGVGSRGYSTIPPPTAAFTWRVVKEAIGGGVGSVIDVFLDGSSSHTNMAGVIVGYSWASATPLATLTPAQVTPTIEAASPRHVFVYPGVATTALITLNVRDTSGKIATYTQTISLVDSPTPGLVDQVMQLPLTRTLSVAALTTWYVSGDGGRTWRNEAGATQAVPPHGAGIGPQSDAVTSTGLLANRGAQLRETLDKLITPSTALATLAAAPTCLALNTADPLRVWAGVGDTVYRSIDGGVSFVNWGRPLIGSTVVDICEDAAVLHSVFVLAGNRMWHSTSTTPPGTAWATLYTGPAGAIAKHLVRTADGGISWLGFTGSFTGSALHRVETGVTVAFPGTPAVTQILALALSYDTQPMLYAWDQAGVAWQIDATAGLSPTRLTAVLPSTQTASHALHDPDVPLVFLGTIGTNEPGRVWKFFPDTGTIYPLHTGATGEQMQRLGFGSKRTALVISLVTIGRETATGLDKLCIYRNGTWSFKTMPEHVNLNASGRWTRVVANRINPYKLLARNLGYPVESKNSLWYSPDLGDTWTRVYQDLPTYYELDASTAVDWDFYTDNRWVQSRSAGIEGVLFGENATYTVRDITSSNLHNLHATPGRDTGEAIGFFGGGPNPPATGLWRIPPAGALVAGSGDFTPRNDSPGLETIIDSYRVIAHPRRYFVQGGMFNIHVSSDYRSVGFSQIVGGNDPVHGGSYAAGLSVAVVNGGDTIFIGTRDSLGGHLGITRVDNAFSGLPTVRVDYATGLSVATIRSDRQLQQAVAAVYRVAQLEYQIAVYDAALGLWDSLPLPPGIGFLHSDWVEPIVFQG